MTQSELGNSVSVEFQNSSPKVHLAHAMTSEQVKPVTAVSKTPTSKRVFKVIIIGDPNVGKTCLSFRFCNGRFPQSTEATIGVDFRERSLTIDGELLRVYSTIV